MDFITPFLVPIATLLVALITSAFGFLLVVHKTRRDVVAALNIVEQKAREGESVERLAFRQEQKQEIGELRTRLTACEMGRSQVQAELAIAKADIIVLSAKIDILNDHVATDAKAAATVLKDAAVAAASVIAAAATTAAATAATAAALAAKNSAPSPQGRPGRDHGVRS